LYLPLYFLLTHVAYEEGLISGAHGAVAFVVAGAFHFLEVGHNVFKAW
jgi:hypothetical protein